MCTPYPALVASRCTCFNGANSNDSGPCLSYAAMFRTCSGALLAICERVGAVP